MDLRVTYNNISLIHIFYHPRILPSTYSAIPVFYHPRILPSTYTAIFPYDIYTIIIEVKWNLEMLLMWTCILLSHMYITLYTIAIMVIATQQHTFRFCLVTSSILSYVGPHVWQVSSNLLVKCCDVVDTNWYPLKLPIIYAICYRNDGCYIHYM